MLLGVVETLSWLSGLLTLEAGDLVFTGTPAGVGPLRPGDIVRCGIDAVGSLERVVQAGPGAGESVSHLCPRPPPWGRA